MGFDGRNRQKTGMRHMSIRIVTPSAEARHGVEMLRSAQHLIVEAAAILGANPEDGGLWDALGLIAAERTEAEAQLSRKRGLRGGRAMPGRQYA
jgi:hypothetical protein